MKAIFFKNPSTSASSIYLQEDRGKYFYDRLHYHPEYQLTFILKGSGTLFVGDKIERFNAGDLFLFGPDLAHVFRNDAEYYDEKSELTVHGLSIYFRENSFGENFFHLPELSQVQALLRNASGGLRFHLIDQATILDRITAIDAGNHLSRLTSFLNLLDQLAAANHSKRISDTTRMSPLRDSDNKRINLVFDYVMNSFQNEIRLETVAELVAMSPPSFSRFFKQRTRKTFSRFLNEVRIGNACRLLPRDSYTIYEAAYASGFNNLSHFNRQFKSVMKMTPKEYIRNIREEIPLF